MKLEVYKHKEDLDTTVRIMLKQDEVFGNVKVIAVDENGNIIERGNLFAITKHGRIKRFSGVNPVLGFDLDESARIKEKD